MPAVQIKKFCVYTGWAKKVTSFWYPSFLLLDGLILLFFVYSRIIFIK